MAEIGQQAGCTDAPDTGGQPPIRIDSGIGHDGNVVSVWRGRGPAPARYFLGPSLGSQPLSLAPGATV